MDSWEVNTTFAVKCFSANCCFVQKRRRMRCLPVVVPVVDCWHLRHPRSFDDNHFANMLVRHFFFVRSFLLASCCCCCCANYYSAVPRQDRKARVPFWLYLMTMQSSFCASWYYDSVPTRKILFVPRRTTIRTSCLCATILLRVAGRLCGLLCGVLHLVPLDWRRLPIWLRVPHLLRCCQ